MTVIGFLIPTIIIYWLFCFRIPSERMIRLLDGDDQLTIKKFTIYNAAGVELLNIADPEGLDYLSKLLSSATKEGRSPSHRPERQHYAIAWLGPIHVAKIGLYPDPTVKGFTIYYPYHEDSTVDIQYYWAAFDGSAPASIHQLYDDFCKIDSRN